jgi:hypothetical protein
MPYRFRMLMQQTKTNVWVNDTEYTPGMIRLGKMRRWAGCGPVKDVMEQFTIDLVAGRVIACPHLDHPQAVFVRMTQPDRVYCRACAVTELLPQLRQPSRAPGCDACGRSSARIKLNESTVQVGALTMFGRICNHCNSAIS